MILIITLIIVGIILIVAEIILIPGIFVVGTLGVGSLSYSTYLAYTSYGPTIGTIVAAINVALIIGCIIMALRPKTWRKLSLNTEISSRSATTPTEAGIMIGHEGRTITRLNPMGKAKINNSTFEVSTLEGLIDQDIVVRVSEIIDNHIYVTIKK